MPRAALLGLVGLLCAGADAGAQRRVELVIAATTDTHGRLRGWDYYANAADPARSLAGAATIVDSIRKVNPERTLLVDAGDLLQGNPLTYVAAKVKRQPVHPVIASMNVMRYDAAVLGNHEFNYGVPLLRDAMAQAGFPFLAANIREESGKAFAAPYTIIERSGVRIGIVGATTPGIMVWDRDNVRAAGLTVTDIVPAVRKAVADARKARADVIVVLLHSGLSEPASYDTVATGLPSENVALRVPQEINGIDAVIFGHSHREVVDSVVNGALLVQPRNWAASVGVAELAVEKRDGRWQVVSRRGKSVRVAGHAEAPAVLAAHTNSHRGAVEWATTAIGRTAARWSADSARVADMPITDFVNETMRRETGADLSATAVFSLDASLDAGAINVAAISRLYPYDNTLRAVRVSGATVRAFLEHASRYYRTMEAGRAPANGIIDANVPGYNFDVLSGADYTLDLSRPVGQRVTRLEFRGRAVQPTDSFTLALNNYRQGGGGGYSMLSGARVVYDRETDIRGLLIEEVRRAGTLDPSRYANRNWKIEPSAAVAAAYAEQTRGRAAEAGGGRPASSIPAGSTPAGSTTPGSAQGIRTVRVIAMSDFHAALGTRPDASGRSYGGAVALSAALERAQRECTVTCVSVIVDGGDIFTGSPASDWDAGRPAADVFNRFDVAAGALGNHEFDFGQDTLRMRLAGLRHAVLGANVRGRDGARPRWIRSDTVVERGGIRIGIVGSAGTHTRTSTKLRNVSDLTFLPPAPIISERTRALRDAGARIVISVIHDGGRCERDQPTVCHGEGLEIAAALTTRPDAFVMGHSHVNLATRVGDMPVVEAASSGRGIVVVDIPLDGGAATSQIREVNGDSTSGADPAVDSIVRAANARVESRLKRPVATLAEALPRRGNQYALGNVIADAARSAGRGDFAVWNNGGIRTDLQAGPLAFGAVHEVSPFGNLLVRVRLRGRDVLKMAEGWVSRGRPDVHISGITVEYDSAATEGSRVVRARLPSGKPVVATQIYTMVINDFMLDGGDGLRPPGMISQEILTIRDSDSLARYLQQLPQPVRVPFVARFRPVSKASR